MQNHPVAIQPKRQPKHDKTTWNFDHYGIRIVIHNLLLNVTNQEIIQMCWLVDNTLTTTVQQLPHIIASVKLANLQT